MPDAVDLTNPAAERAVVGAALIGHHAGLETLEPAVDLTDPRLVAVGEAGLRLLADGRSVEPAAVLTALQAKSDYPWTRTSAVGVFLADLISVDTVAMPAQAVWLAQAVRAATCRRRLAMAAERLSGWTAGDLEPDRLVEQIGTELREVTVFATRIVPPVLQTVVS